MVSSVGNTSKRSRAPSFVDANAHPRYMRNASSTMCSGSEREQATCQRQGATIAVRRTRSIFPRWMNYPHLAWLRSASDGR